MSTTNMMVSRLHIAHGPFIVVVLNINCRTRMFLPLISEQNRCSARTLRHCHALAMVNHSLLFDKERGRDEVSLGRFAGKLRCFINRIVLFCSALLLNRLDVELLA